MTQGCSETLRLGCVKYLNARPLIHGWPGPVDFDHPAALSKKLADGDLDVALVSSFEYLRQPIYTIVDEVAIGSDGQVYSVILAHRGPLAELKEIALDPASQTSVNLLQCLLAEEGLNPRFVPLSAHGEITSNRARLLIGDQAIRFRQQQSGDWKLWDLGAAWKSAVGLPFIFALWLVRPEIQNASAIADLLRIRRDQNLASLDQLIGQQREFPAEFCQTYYRDHLRFGFAEREKQGLLKFRSLCERHGILSADEAALRLA